MEKNIHILMTGGGAPGAAGIIKCLLQDKAVSLTVADADEQAVGRHLHSSFVVLPKAGEDNFIESLLSICQERNIDVLLPLVTKELLPLSKNKHRFKAIGTTVMVSDADAITIANDKGKCYQFLQEKGIPIPQFFKVKTTEEFVHAAFELGHPKAAFCFKPCVANGSRGFRVVSDSINEADQLFLEKPYNTNITYAHALKILSSQSFPPLVVSEFLPGEEYSVDCVASKGNVVLCVPRLREKMINGISVKGRFVKDAQIIAYCKEIILALELQGNIGLQVKRSEDGTPLLLEINPRVQGTIISALGAGVNLPLLAVKLHLGLTIAASETAVKWNTSFARYWTEVFY